MRRNWIVVLVSTLILTACGPMYEHRLLDGHWQMRHITYTDGETEPAEDIYFGFQLHLVQLRNLKGGSLFGEFDYVGDSLFVHLMGASSQASMHPFGMNDTLQRFQVDELTSRRLVLQSSYARLEFRKY